MGGSSTLLWCKMGKRVGHIVMALVSLSILLTSIGMIVSFQKVSIFLTTIKAGEFEMSLLRFKVDVSAESDLCPLFSALGVRCQRGEWGPTLHHTSRFSISPFREIFPNLSNGLANAYAYGTALFIVLVMQICLQLTALWLYYMYLNDKPSAQFRTTGQLVIIIALVSTVLATMTYWLMVSYYLVGSQSGGASLGGLGFPLSTFSTLGFMLEGHWLNLVSMAVQGITIVLGCQMELKEEVLYTDAKNARRFEMEMGQGQTNLQDQQNWQGQQNWQSQPNWQPSQAQQWQPSQGQNWQAQAPPMAQQQNWQAQNQYGGHHASLSQPPHAGPPSRGSLQQPPPGGAPQQPYGGYDGHRGSYPIPPNRPSALH